MTNTLTKMGWKLLRWRFASKSGMGSGSCFVVSMIQLINHFLKKKLKKKNLALQSINFEQVKLKEIVGSQDQIAASYGGFNNITFKRRKF